MNKMEKIVIKITNYKGNVTHAWRVPKTKRQTAGQMKKLLKLFYRCKTQNLLTKELIEVIKKYADTLSKIATEVFIVNPELIELFKEIKNYNAEDLKEEIVAEKKRVHENQKCSLCTTKLVYPAYVVYRKNTEIVKISTPIGIFCLKALYRKLNDLVVDIKAEYKDIFDKTNTQKTHEYINVA